MVGIITNAPVFSSVRSSGVPLNIDNQTDAKRFASLSVPKPAAQSDVVSKTDDVDPVEALFNKFDLDGNRRISRDEILKVLSEDGSELAKKAEIIISSVLSPTTDLDGDGLSLDELHRYIKIAGGDVFALGDHNNDDRITTQELEDTIRIYTANGDFSGDDARQLFKVADYNKDGVLTRDEFNKFIDQPKVVDAKPVPPVNPDAPKSDLPSLLEKLFDQFDTDKNGLVTRDEIRDAVIKNGGSEEDAEAVIANILSRTTDIDGNGLSRSELSRRLKVDQGDTFAAGDLNNDGQITSDELDTAIKLYSTDGNKIDADRVREFFANADTNKDKILTRAEFVAYNKKDSVVSDAKPVTPINPDVPDIFHRLFHEFDADGNGLVTREEIIAAVLKNGGTEDVANALADNILSATTDIDGNGLSISELERRLKVDQGDAFAAADLNNDGSVTAEELDEAIKLYSANGSKLNPQAIHDFFNSADVNKDKVLTRAEYNNYNDGTRPVNDAAASKPQKPAPDINAYFHQLFTQFDRDSDGLVTRSELIAGLQGQGFSDNDIESLIANILSPTTDLNGDGLSRAELDRRLAVDRGDTFAAFDLNSDNLISVDELNQGIALYSKIYDNFDAERARKIFGAADLNNDKILSREELAAYDKGVRRVADSVNDNFSDQRKVDVKAFTSDADLEIKLKPAGISIATLDTQLILLLQQQDQA